MNIIPLKWDSEFFNLKIGKVTDSAAGIQPTLQDIENYDLIYIERYNSKRLNNTYTKLFDPAYTDKKIIYLKTLTNAGETDIHVRPYTLKNANAAMKDLAIQSGTYSRFKLDSNFENKLYKKLYTRWVQNSVQQKSADAVLIYGELKKPLGFITVVFKDTFAQVGLIAVDAAHQKKGIGKSLMDAAEYFALKNNFFKLQIITQAENKKACRFYENRGFKKEAVIYTHHHWNK